MVEFNFTPFPNLATERLFLRQLDTEDVNDVFFVRSNKHVNEFIDRTPTLTIADAAAFIERITKSTVDKQLIMWAITMKNDPRVIGTVVFWKLSKELSRAELGYELHPSFHRQGIMQEVFNHVLPYGFDVMKVKTIEAYTHRDNLPSRNLLEKNAFFRDELAEKEIDRIKEPYALIYRRHRQAQ